MENVFMDVQIESKLPFVLGFFFCHFDMYYSMNKRY